MLASAPAMAQAQAPVPSAQAAPALAAPQQTVTFSADQVTYDSDADVVTAQGEVRLARDGNYVAAEQVVWDRKTDVVTAKGNVVVLTPEGDKLLGNDAVLTNDMHDAAVSNLLVVLENGGRIAAQRGNRTGDVTTLENAIFSPCPVTTDSGCPKRPSWAITAARVINDPAHNRIRFLGGRLQLFGITLPLLPVFNIATGKEGATGWLAPDFSISSKKGFELAVPFHWQIASNRDLTITPHVYTGVFPAIEAKYRDLNSLGAFQLGGFLTYGTIDQVSTTATSSRKSLRGYFEGNGKFQLDPVWSITSSLRVATDKTVTRRYDITSDDRLRSFVNAERIDPDSYISIAAWAFEGLRADDKQKQIPIALPAIDARFRRTDVVGGTLQIQANSLSIIRVEGQDTQRAFASAEWDLRRLTPWGQQVTLTAFGRGDVYHTDDAESTPVPIYRGENGWHTRAIGALAADIQWPFVGPLFGGVQRLTPRVQVVLTPPTPNFDIPNEDARSVDLEDSNLFALNRFPGYDRWEDSSRITYGLDWSLDRPNLTIDSTVGQSVRFRKDLNIFPEGTGLNDRVSDFVGRTRIRYGRLLEITHRYRVDKSNFAVRRNEVDLTIGTQQTYAQVGYLRLNRNIDPSVEDLRDKEELRLAGRVLFHRYWSIFGATVIDLTDKREDPLSLADGWQPVRHRLGIQYEDDCLEVGLTWRRDYEQIGAFRKGSTFSLHLAFKGLNR
ncbi:MAG TPA: LPS assembly protein LptD [Sphingomicrobium sp.]|jgi:LPS-assembly protein|nr:LPS assembly protein LptD [Sphingomicrobium sp.]